MSKIYYQGETMRQKVQVKDKDGVLLDPDTITITIRDPEDVEMVSAADMGKKATGIYDYGYFISADGVLGKWTTEVKAEKGFIAIEQDVFTVIEAL